MIDRLLFRLPAIHHIFTDQCSNSIIPTIHHIRLTNVVKVPTYSGSPIGFGLCKSEKSDAFLFMQARTYNTLR